MQPYLSSFAALFLSSLAPVASAAEVSTSISFIPVIALQDVALSGSDRVAVNDRALAVSPDNAKAFVIATNDTGQVEVGADAEVQDVISNGKVFMRDRSCATGDVEADVYRAQNQVEILGDLKVAQKAAVEQMAIRVANEKVAKTVDPVTQRRVAKAEAPSVLTKPDQVHTVELSPATYGAVKVERGATVKVAAGNYVIERLQMEPGSRLVLDESLGPVNIAVKGAIKWAGDVEHVGSRRPLGTVLAETSSWIHLETELKGSLVAPKASVNMVKSNAMNVGSVWAKRVELHQGSTIVRSTPCFEAHCFWENPASTLELAKQKVLVSRARLLEPREDALEQLQYDLEDLLGKLRATTQPAELGSLLDSPELDDAGRRLKKVADEIGDAKGAMRSLETLVASRKLAKAEDLIEDATCVEDEALATDVADKAGALKAKLASMVDSTQTPDDLDPVIEQTERLFRELVQQTSDVPQCDLDLASTYSKTQEVLKVAKRELDDEGLEANSAAAKLEAAVARAREAALPSELEKAIIDLEDAMESAGLAAKSAAKKAAKDQFALQAVVANVPE